jgi:hypothetical protein
MSAVLGTQQNGNADDVSRRLNFFKSLQAVTNKIHATSNVDEIMLDLSQDLCELFQCDRLTIYAVAEDKTSIVSKVKTGLNEINRLKLPISEQSIAGHVALTRKMINLRDVYDDAELKSHSPEMQFLREVDRRTGYRTKQMLVAPISDERSNELLGVVQMINSRDGAAFSAIAEEGVKELCKTLAIAYAQRLKPQPLVRGKYDQLVAEAVLSAPELELATRSARRKTDDIELVLVREFQVKLSAIGNALGKFFGVPYEPFKQDRIKPVDLLKNLKRDFVEQSQWLPIEDGKDGLVIVATDPEQVKSARVINTIFPKLTLTYRVTTNHEFRQTVDQFYGAEGDTGSVDDLLSGLDDDEEYGEISEADISAAAENELVKLVNKIIIDAYRQGASDIHIEPRPG